MKIQVINPIFCYIPNKDDVKILSPILSYKGSVWRRGPFQNKEEERIISLVNKGVFLTGFLPSIRTFCNHNRIELEIIWPDHCWPTSNVHVKNPPGIELDEDQKQALSAMTIKDRGVIYYPTGSGKTEIFLSYIYNNCFNTIIIVNSQDLLFQTYNRASAMFGKDAIGIIGASHFKKRVITIATYQSLSKIIYDDKYSRFLDFIDCIIVDECHHVSSFSKPFNKSEGSYAKILTRIGAHKRFGFTATLPYLNEAKKALEGYIGPVIAHKRIQESGRLAKMKIILKKIPETKRAKESKTYQDVYKWGVVYNTRRNKQVLVDAMHMVEQGRTVLILVVAIQHGLNIKKLCSKLYPNLKIDFVWGGVVGTYRERVREDFNKKEMDIVIADAVWKEGVDIPSVGCVINAAGGKSEIQVIQSIGRGLRKIEGEKEDLIFFDYFDPSHRYLRDHFSERLTLYFEKGWL